MLVELVAVSVDVETDLEVDVEEDCVIFVDTSVRVSANLPFTVPAGLLFGGTARLVTTGALFIVSDVLIILLVVLLLLVLRLLVKLKVFCKFIILSGSLIVLIQLSLEGFNIIVPEYSTTWKGFTFSTLVANGCSIQSIESYFKVTVFPVFCTLSSKSLKFSDKSIFSSETKVLGVIIFFILFLDINGVNSLLFWSTSTVDMLRLIKLAFEKSSTKNPVLNLLKPCASCICKVWVFNSNKDNDVVISNLSSLSSILPISLIVYLLLSTNNSLASLGLYKYGGRIIVAKSIMSSILEGSFGFIAGVPFSIMISPNLFK